MLKKTEKTPVEAVGTACLDVCEDVSSGEQAPRASLLTPIISAKSPLRLAKTLKSKMRGHPAWTDIRAPSVIPSFWKEGLGVVEKNNVRHICFICCDRVCSATTPHPSSPEEGTTGRHPAVSRVFYVFCRFEG